ncbi:Engulfment/cell motility [Macleaya cordata]|uniref:Engulfment/cell motility n=1 Tax=Macleaya cordata TaxID=56857 RepID=A0A200QLJ3_MACCD|nr:Engulfment/cell motility [Macleaya cordata]
MENCWISSFTLFTAAISRRFDWIRAHCFEEIVAMDGRGGSFVAVRRISQDHSHSAEVVAGSGAWIGKGLSCVCAQRRESDARLSFDLTPSQEECLQKLQRRIEANYDSSNPEHQEALRALWNASFPGEELRDLISEQWKEMGWQGKDPATDFRGGGFISLENLLFFATTFPKSFQDLLQKQEGNRAMWEYPFAVAGVNITFMLIQMLDLEAVKPRTLAGAVFLKLLAENESAFDILYCITFKLMDQQWLAMNASYMDFNTVMKSTQHELQKQLLLLEDITRIEDMPYYSLLQ